MATFLSQEVVGSYVAAADLSNVSNQFTFVKLDVNGQVVPIAAATDVPIGVLQNYPKLGGTAEVVIIGGTKLKASAAIAVTGGALLGTTATGTAVKLVPGTDITKYILGVADISASAAGDVIGAIVNCASPSRAA
jgi:hypothetical protein